MRKVLAIILVAAALMAGCSVHVRESNSGVDVDIRPANITIQAGAEPKSETASVDLPKEAKSLEFIFNQGAGELRIDGEEETMAFSGAIGYWQTPPPVRTQTRGSRFVVEIPGEKNVAAVGRGPRTEMHLNSQIPTRLEINAGAGDARIDLTRLAVTELDMKAGVGQMTVLVPAGRNVRVNLTAGIGTHNLREAGFVKEGSSWLSPDYKNENVLDIRLEAGIGQFRLERR